MTVSRSSIPEVARRRLAPPGQRFAAQVRAQPVKRLRGLRFFLVVVLAGAALSAAFYLAGLGMSRALIAAGAGVFLAAAAVTWPRESLAGLFIWLACLGGVRRVLSLFTPRGDFDPLLGIAPLVWVLLLLVSLQLGTFRRQTWLSKGVLLLGVVVLASSLNPAQSSLRAGVAGLAFTLIPMLAFWVGKALADDRTMNGLVRLIAFLAIPVAVYGLLQVLVGFPRWDQDWIDKFGYAALNVRGVTRPFATFASGVEYGLFLAVAAIFWLSWRSGGLRRSVFLLPIGLLFAGIFYEASRTVLVMLVVAIATVAAARRRMRPVRAAFACLTLLGMLFLLARTVSLDGLRHLPGGALIVHQLGGLSSPLDTEESTLRFHLEMFRDGLLASLWNPIGAGPGAVTPAGEKMGVRSGSTEADLSNVSVAFGIPGLVAYLIVLWIGYTSAYALAVQRRDPVSLAVLAVLVVNAQQWLQGGHYLMAPLVWLCLGWVEQKRLELREQRRQARQAGSAWSSARVPLRASAR